jgi:hypothetical protein
MKQNTVNVYINTKYKICHNIQVQSDRKHLNILCGNYGDCPTEYFDDAHDGHSASKSVVNYDADFPGDGCPLHGDAAIRSPYPIGPDQ